MTMSHMRKQAIDLQSWVLPQAQSSPEILNDSGVRSGSVMIGGAGAGADMDNTSGDGMDTFIAERYNAGTMVTTDCQSGASPRRAHQRSRVMGTIDVASLEGEEEGPSRKKAKTEGPNLDDEAKKARGRPRLDAKDETATDVRASSFMYYVSLFILKRKSWNYQGIWYMFSGTANIWGLEEEVAIYPLWTISVSGLCNIIISTTQCLSHSGRPCPFLFSKNHQSFLWLSKTMSFGTWRVSFPSYILLLPRVIDAMRHGGACSYGLRTRVWNRKMYMLTSETNKL